MNCEIGEKECLHNFKVSSEATGGYGGSSPLTAKNGQKSGKREGKSGKRRKIGKRQKSGRFFYFAPPDR